MALGPMSKDLQRYSAHLGSLPECVRGASQFCEFLGDMAALGVTPLERHGRRYAVIAARSNRRWWLLPLDRRRAAAMSLEMLQPVTPVAQMAKCAASTLARFGPLRFLGRGRISLTGLSEQADLQLAFRGNAAHVACFTGTDGPHRKTALQIMDSTANILGYAKLSRAPHVRPYLRNEARVLRQLSELDLRSADVPELLRFRDDSAVTLLITDSLKSAASAAPLVLGPAHLAFLNELRNKSERLGAEPTLQWLRQQTARVAQTAGAAWVRLLDQVMTALQPYAGSIPVCLTHGDFTPWNSFLQRGRLYVFDWEYAQQAWPVGFDLVHFHLATVAPEAQPSQVPTLVETLSCKQFEGNKTLATRSLLLSLACHAVFYIGRLHEAGQQLEEWPGSAMRAEMIEHLLEGGLLQ